MVTMQVMRDMTLTVEEVDALTGPVMGRPKTATFRLADLVGLDTFLHVAANVREHAPDDESHDMFTPPAFLEQMLEKGLLGRKSGAGFYKKVKGGDGSTVLTLDLATLEYREKQKASFPELEALKSVDDPTERLAKLVSGNLRMPFLSVPTSASHDGIASPRASIRDGGNSLSLNASVPLGIVADTAMIVKAPYRLLASGCADVISNTTAILDWELADRLRGEFFSSSAANLAKYAAESIIDNAATFKPNLEDSVWIAIRPIIISGISMAVASSSRPTSGSEHMFSHVLDKIAPGKALHGEQCGVGSIMMMYLHGGDWERIREALRMIGAPTNAEELGVSSDQVIQALVNAHEIRKDRYTILGDRGLAPDAAERLARITKVI
ncbi:TPA: iron-containing alcohol dehydrogenase [Thermoplasmata archaeon]|nr:iron-containing alcohol dehydrogenase [Thermoplasmata archaeon]